MKREEQNKQNKEHAILEAAEKEFLSKGFESARTMSIAQEAGVTHAMLHYYFRTKEALFDKILDNKVGEITNKMKLMIGDDTMEIKERIQKCIATHFDFFVENPEMPRFILNEIVPYPDRLQKITEQIIGKLALPFMSIKQAYEKAIEKGEIEYVPLKTIMLDMASLNLFVFMALPLVAKTFAGNDLKGFLETRKQENIDIIMRRITKQ